jgi:hypothetical protein
MRLARFVGAFVALILAVTMGQALTQPSLAAAKPKHSISAHGYEKGNTDRFYVKGKVATFPKGKIKILRNVSGGPFKTYKKVKTRSSGKFKTRIFQVGRKKTCFKVQVPGTATYKKTTTPNLGCITSS